MPKFECRHYQAIAESINRMIWDTPLNMEELVGVIKTRNQLVKMFHSDNPNFKESVFLAYCRKGLTVPHYGQDSEEAEAKVQWGDF